MQVPNSKSVQEAAVLLKITELRVLNMIHEGILPAVNVGRGKQRPRWRILDEDLDQFGRRLREIGSGQLTPTGITVPRYV